MKNWSKWKPIVLLILRILLLLSDFVLIIVAFQIQDVFAGVLAGILLASSMDTLDDDIRRLIDNKRKEKKEGADE